MNGTAERPPLLETTLLLAALCLLYADVVPAMVTDWYVDENYSHGFLIPFVSAYVLWTRRGEIRRAARRARPSLVGLLVCLGSLALLVVGRAGAEFFLQRSSLVFLLAGSVLWMWGWPVFRVTAFSLLFLLFMVPLPYLVYDSVAFPLKLLAARVATDSLFHLGVPVFREGNIIHLASQTLEVADACSGIRSLVSLVALGVVYAYFTESVLWKRVVIVLSTVPIAIAANAFRVTGTGWLTHYVSPEAAEGFFHTFSGWLVFVVAFLLLFGVGGGLKLVGRRRRP
ncbi:MAG: hypothetical protein Kow0092_26550 [Deferrisomatales bacterium]